MAEATQSIVCQRCGLGFMMTSAHRDFLTRRGLRVKTPMQCMSCFLRRGPFPKQTGRVKWFSSRKRYGFITADEGQEVFLHQQQILEGGDLNPREGQVVWFHVYQSPKGLEAWNVELAGE